MATFPLNPANDPDAGDQLSTHIRLSGWEERDCEATRDVLSNIVARCLEQDEGSKIIT